MIVTLFLNMLYQILDFFIALIPNIGSTVTSFIVPSSMVGRIISLNSLFPIYTLLGAIVIGITFNLTVVGIKVSTRVLFGARGF